MVVQQHQFSWWSCFLRLVPALNRWCHKRCAKPSGAAGTGDAIGQFLDKPLYLDCLSFLQTRATQGLGQIRSGETITVHFFSLSRRSAVSPAQTCSGLRIIHACCCTVTISRPGTLNQASCTMSVSWMGTMTNAQRLCIGRPLCAWL